MVSWARADVVILTAIELEYAAVKRVDAGAVLGSRWVEEQHNGSPVALREFVDSGGRRLRIAVGRAPDMGKGSALTTLLPLVDALRPACIAMCGVCAGRPGKTALGDVVVGERLYDYDTGKWTEVGIGADVRTYSLPAPWKIACEQFRPKARFGGEDWWRQRPVPYEWQEAWVLAQLHKGVADPEALPESKARCPQWSTVIENLWASRDVKKNTRTLTEKKGRSRAAGVAIQYPQFPDLSPGGELLPFQVHVQPIGSGSAVREDVGVWGFITPHMRKTLALEMEASALADIVRAREHYDPIKAVVMKGVMDFANHGRDDHFKDYAARASAECLIAFLREQVAGGAAASDGEAGERHPLLGGGGVDARIAIRQPVTGVQLHDRLLKVTDALFEQVLLTVGVDRNLVSPRTAPLAARVLDVAELAAFDPALCRRLADELDARAPWTRAQPPPTPPRVALDPASRAPAPVVEVSAEVAERLARVKREIAALSKARPGPFAQLATRVGCRPEELPDRLVDLRGSVVAEHVLAVSDAQPSTSEGDADCDALRSVLFTVLPFVSEWRDEVASCCARGEDVVELRYRSDTIAEAVMAGWVDRQCFFEHKSGAEPYGVGAVQIPASAQTALFTSEEHLRDEVVQQLVYQLGVGGLTAKERRTRVQAALRVRGGRGGRERMRYYFLFRDAASPDAETLWGLARTTLHGAAGLPSLVLVRMQRPEVDDDEASLEDCVALMLRPRTPPRS